MARVLLVDDEPPVLNVMLRMLEANGHRVLPTTSAEEALQLIEAIPIDVALVDLRLLGMDGHEFFSRARRRLPNLPGIAFTGVDFEVAAPRALTNGFAVCLHKPVTHAELEAAIRSMIPTPLRAAPAGASGLDDILGTSDAMREVLDLVLQVAPTQESVLIQGETGTGKELIAQAIHRHSTRASGQFETVDCTLGPESLLESELFGHERGAFTDASQRVIGWLEKAHGGTVFLDEIGELPAAAQAKLLGFLERREITRIGGRDRIKVDVRVIAATNVDLEAAVGRTFRRDLYERLRVFDIRVPPLRDRQGDIRLLVDHYLRRICAGFLVPVPAISDEVCRLFDLYAWPGNVRELQNLLKRAVARSRGSTLEPAHIDVEIALSRAVELADLPWSIPRPEGVPMSAALRQANRALAESWITEALARTGGNVGRAAELLRASRRTIERRARRRSGSAEP
jgi:DNA-binding NtrC family response regulator